MALNHPIDIETARKIADGDAWVTENFVASHYASLARFMRHLTQQREDAEDLTQQAFIKAKQQIASYRGKASLRTWLYRIAFHEYTHWKRRHRRTQRLSEAPAQMDPGFDACVESESLKSALRLLPDALQEAFLLFEVQQLTLEETAAVLRIPQGTVKSRLFNARRKLHQMLTESNEDQIEAKPILES